MPNEYGGLGGIKGGRNLNVDDAFEMLIKRLFRPDMSQSEEFCERIYSSITNVTWRNRDDDTASYSFRAAGDMIAAILGEGDYMNWYCSAPEGRVDADIASQLAVHGWKPDAE